MVSQSVLFEKFSRKPHPKTSIYISLVRIFVTWSLLTGRSVGEVGSTSRFCYHSFLGHHDPGDEAGP